jgi:hypothetical protein
MPTVLRRIGGLNFRPVLRDKGCGVLRRGKRAERQQAGGKENSLRGLRQPGSRCARNPAFSGLSMEIHGPHSSRWKNGPDAAPAVVRKN